MSVPILGYPTPPPPGLNEIVEASYPLSNVGGVWVTDTAEHATAIMAIVATYNPIPFVLSLKRAEALAVKIEVENGGITTSGGHALDTSPENQLRLLRVACSTEATPLPATFYIHRRDGTVVNLTRTAARTLGSDIGAFFQACANGEGLALAAINAPGLTWQQILAVNIRQFFPANS